VDPPSDTDRDTYSDTDCNAHCDTNRYSDCDAHSDTDCDTHGHTGRDTYSHAHCGLRGHTNSNAVAARTAKASAGPRSSPRTPSAENWERRFRTCGNGAPN